MNGFAVASVTADNQFARTLATFCGVQSYIDDLIFNPIVFSGGEYCPKAVPDAINDKRVYLVASPMPKGADPQDPGGPQDLFARILIATDALKRNGAKEVYLVYPDMHYSRQDRGPHDLIESEKAKKEGKPHKMLGQSLTALVQAKHFKVAGVDKVITIHPHSKKLYKMFGAAWMGYDEYMPEWNDEAKEREMYETGKKILYAINPAPVVSHYILNNSKISKLIATDGSNLVFLVPDEGARPFADDVRKYTFLEKTWLIQCKKIRKVPNDPNQVDVDIIEWPEGLDTLKNKFVVVVDDGSETGGTIENAALALRKIKHIRKDETIGNPAGLVAYLTHPWLNGQYNRITQQKLAGIKDMIEIIVGNTWPYIDDGRVAKFKEISTVLRFAKCLNQAILCFESDEYKKGEITLDNFFSFKTWRELDREVPELYAIKRSEMWEIEHHSRKTKPIKINGLLNH